MQFIKDQEIVKKKTVYVKYFELFTNNISFKSAKLYMYITYGASCKLS